MGVRNCSGFEELRRTRIIPESRSTYTSSESIRSLSGLAFFCLTFAVEAVALSTREAPGTKSVKEFGISFGSAELSCASISDMILGGGGGAGRGEVCGGGGGGHPAGVVEVCAEAGEKETRWTTGGAGKREGKDARRRVDGRNGGR